MDTKLKVLLDTDIGNDIDDAIALAYLLAHPGCQLLGVTTVTGQPELRAMMCSAICQVASSDVPIYPGTPAPLLAEQRQPTPPQAAALGRWTHRTDFPRGEAIQFMRRVIRDNPGEVVLLTIGPLTNIALLFTLDPEIPSLLKALAPMCGVFSSKLAGSPAREWNALNDPEATAIVYRARPPVHRSIGLDVTRQVTMPAEEVRKRFTAPLLRPVLDFAEVWFKERQVITFHDPLAAAAVMQPDLCGYERGCVDIELASPRFAGATLFSADPDGPHEVATTVNPHRYFDHFFAVMNKA